MDAARWSSSTGCAGVLVGHLPVVCHQKTPRLKDCARTDEHHDPAHPVDSHRQPRERLRMLRRCSRTEQRTDLHQEHHPARHSTHAAEMAYKHGEVRIEESTMDRHQLYGHLRLGTQRMEPVGLTPVRLPSLSRGSQHSTGNEDSTRCATTAVRDDIHTREERSAKEFTLDNYPDSTWTFVDSKTVQTAEGYVPPIHDFSIQDNKTGEDITQEVLNDTGYTFLLISPTLAYADDSNFGRIDQIYEFAQDYGYRFICLTASSDKDIAKWQDITGAEYPFYTTDATTLKTMIRSNPGLMLLHHGTIIQKWSHNKLPQPEELNQPLEKSALGKMPSDSIPRKILLMLMWFVLPLTLLAIADRLWAWTTWVKKKKENANKIISTFNKKEKKMRKKIVAGNWKMNMNLQDGVALAKEINEALVADKPNCDVIICTPFIHLASVAQVLNAEVVGLGAENCADKEKGAYTGEVSAEW